MFSCLYVAMDTIANPIQQTERARKILWPNSFTWIAVLNAGKSAIELLHEASSNASSAEKGKFTTICNFCSIFPQNEFNFCFISATWVSKLSCKLSWFFDLGIFNCKVDLLSGYDVQLCGFICHDWLFITAVPNLKVWPARVLSKSWLLT